MKTYLGNNIYAEAKVFGGNRFQIRLWEDKKAIILTENEIQGLLQFVIRATGKPLEHSKL